MMPYKIFPYDDATRWIVEKDSTTSYFVQLNPGKGHVCNCRAGECGKACKHILLVLNHVLSLYHALLNRHD